MHRGPVSTGWPPREQIGIGHVRLRILVRARALHEPAHANAWAHHHLACTPVRTPVTFDGCGDADRTEWDDDRASRDSRRARERDKPILRLRTAEATSGDAATTIEDH